MSRVETGYITFELRSVAIATAIQSFLKMKVAIIIYGYKFLKVKILFQLPYKAIAET